MKTVILGAAGRDFHNFNVLYRDDPAYEVVAFTAQQIPHIAGRRYPSELAGARYPAGIPIHEEDRLEELILEYGVRLCVMAYSDIAHEEVMHLASRANAAGADFVMIAARRTMLRASVPVVAVCAARTGAGKSQTSRAVVRRLREAGLRVAVVRHPMPYGDLVAQRVQRFATREDLIRQQATIEEREEYEPHLDAGSIVFAGVDYAAILEEAEREADVIVWDGGNNDTAFIEPTVTLVVVDPHRAGHESRYYPGETNVRLADVILINKVDTAERTAVEQIERNVRALNPTAMIMKSASRIRVDDPELLIGKQVLAIEDGPTVTHGGMTYGAATIAALRSGATLVDPRPFAVGELAETFAKYPKLGRLLPAMGYGDRQIRDLHETIARAAEQGVEVIAIGTPIDLAQLIELPRPYVRVRYTLEVLGQPTLDDALAPVLRVTAGSTP